MQARYDDSDGALWRDTRPPGLSGVIGGRFFAFFVDSVIITTLFLGFCVLLFFAGFATFGLTWFLIPPLYWIVALFYNGLTISGPAAGTVGMRLLGIRLLDLDGNRLTMPAAAIHAVLFYLSISLMTPLILLVGLARVDRRLLHDILIGAIAVRDF